MASFKTFRHKPSLHIALEVEGSPKHNRLNIRAENAEYPSPVKIGGISEDSASALRTVKRVREMTVKD